MDTTTPGHQTSRRTLLTAGGAGLAATALLAACSDAQDIVEPGISGSPTSTTLVPPTVPDRAPTQAELQADADLLATANSLETLAADVYRRFTFDDPELNEAGARFASDHEAAAALFGAEVPDHDGVDEPNEYLLVNLVQPVENLLDTDAAIADLTAAVERAIAATYIAGVGTLLEAEWRQTMAEHAAAAARRAALLGDGGAGIAPTSALFPMNDLIANDAYLVAPEEGAAEESPVAEAEAEGGNVEREGR
jgi:hypothetical protein